MVDMRGRVLPMGLNIKNERVCALAREAAVATGQTQTSVIETALEALLERHRADASQGARSRRIDEIISDLQRSWADTSGEQVFTAEDLYDDNGLPA